MAGVIKAGVECGCCKGDELVHEVAVRLNGTNHVLLGVHITKLREGITVVMGAQQWQR